MTRTALVTLGRLPKGLELARCLAGAGWRVVIAEPWAWHLSRLSRDVDRSLRVTAPNDDLAAYHRDLLEVIADENVSLVVPVSEEIFHVAALADRLPDGVRLFSPDPEALLALHDKLGLMQRAASLGLPVPATFALGSEEAARFAADNDVIVKPTLSSAGKGVVVHRAGTPLPAPAEPSLVQAYLPGEELSSFSVAHEGRVIGTVVYRGRIVSGTVAVCFEALQTPDPGIVEWVESFVAGVGHSGFISFDFRRDAEGRALPMECNPRTTSGIHFVAPEDLARAIEDPGADNPFRLRAEPILQQFYPALTETQGAALKGRPWRGNLKHLFGCRDVAWRPADPLPFLLLPVTSYEILRRTLFRGMSFGEATTEDIGWYAGDEGST